MAKSIYHRIMINTSFKDALRIERKRLGWSRKTAAERTGIPNPTFESWERGKLPPKYVQRYVLLDLSEKCNIITKDEIIKKLSGKISNALKQKIISLIFPKE